MTMGKADVQSALSHMEDFERLTNVILYLTHPPQYAASQAARRQMVNSAKDPRVLQNLKTWPSLFTGMSWMINRRTPPHRDPAGFTAGFDYLSALGSAHAMLELEGLGLKVAYARGLVVGLAGKALTHEVKGWEGGDRVCIARWIRRLVFQDLEVEDVGWATIEGVATQLMV